MSANLEIISTMATRLEKVSFYSNPKKGNAKECSNYHQLHSFHMLVILCSKFFKLGFSSTWTKNFQMYKLGFKKAKESEIKLSTYVGSWRKQRNSIKTSTSASWTTLKPLTMWITTNCGKFSKRWKYQTTLSVSSETYVWVKKQQLEPDMGQQTGSKLGNEYDKAIHCYSAYLTYR